MRRALLLAAIAAGCASPRASPEPARPTPPPTAPAPWEGAREAASAAGAWRVAYRISADPVPRGEPFSLEAWVFGAGDAGTPREDVELQVDASMPEHGHGMSRVPRAARLPGGRFRVEGLFFHMPGRWELTFDVTRGPWTERAQVDLQVE